MKKINLNKVFEKGKAMYLAYDQGLEHGPSVDFNDKNIDPLYIIEIAKNAGYNGLIVGKGIAEKYNKEIKKSKVPLIVKLNGKTKLFKGEPISLQLCSVKEAIKLGAKAVGYTIYVGSAHESKMLKEFERIEEEAHVLGLPVIAWIYPRGKSVKNSNTREMISYAARIGLEIGADIVKLHWNGNSKDLEWAVKSAGRCKIVVAGGSKMNEKEFLENVKEIISSGAVGVAVGRNVWQNKNPIELSKKIRKIIFS